MSGIKRNLSTPANREFWAFVDKTAKDVAENFPKWKRGDIDMSDSGKTNDCCGHTIGHARGCKDAENSQLRERVELLEATIDYSGSNVQLIRELRKKLVAAEEKRDMWLRIAQRLFKERQTMLHGHVYDLPTDDVILEATILEAVIDGNDVLKEGM